MGVLIKLKLRLLLSSIILVVFSACTYDSEEDVIPSIQETCDTDSIKYSEQIQKIISTNCAISGCHFPGSGVGNFTSYQGVQSKVNNGSFRNRVIVRKDMPPDRNLSNCEVEQLIVWLDDGALNN